MIIPNLPEVPVGTGISQSPVLWPSKLFFTLCIFFFFWEKWFSLVSCEQERIYEADFHFRLKVSRLHIFLTNWLCSVLMYHLLASLLDLWMFIWLMHMVGYKIYNILKGAGAAAPGITEVFCLISLNGALKGMSRMLKLVGVQKAKK